MPKRKSNVLTFKSLLLQNPFGLIVAASIGAIASLAAVALLGISGWFLSAAGLAAVVGTALTFDFLTPGALVRLMAILRTAGRYGEQVFSHDHLLGLLRTLRLWVWDQRKNLPFIELNKQTKGDLLQRLIGDLDQIIKWPLAVVMPWLYASLGCLSLLVLSAFIVPTLWPWVVVFSAIQLVLLPWLAHRLCCVSVFKMQALSTHRRARFMSVFGALITLTIRGSWTGYARKLQTLDNRQKEEQARIQRTSSAAKYLTQITTFALIAVTLRQVLSYTDGVLVLDQGIQATWLVALLLVMLAVNELIQPLSIAFIAQGQSKVGLRRLNQIAEQGVNEEAPACKLGVTIRFEDLVGGYRQDIQQKTSLMGINGDVSLGESLRVVGKSGAGKSTLLATLAGDLPFSGYVYLGDRNLDEREASITSNAHWYKQVAYLPQNPIIFQQSLASNLRLGAPSATDQELVNVLQVLGLGEWLESLPNGLDTLLGAQGRDVSGGQARRIALGRALLRKAPLMLLDEPFDGLDSASIQRVCDAISSHSYSPDYLIYVSHIDSPLDQMAMPLKV
ncbi:ATP-binding cassette domain-containing protein [Marinomonas mediterranea]|uniref:amino acid ABC transporter ATP-binding/permease protein n=1 Tax=Marinomonas mediterranea TaxID=119864 RepID=UPI0023499228|nr:ATP-binding cassette domain-containing protein [Marinomonas mediterranea]WCN13895.1 ATP-binding cassette domain-containing protein [Marinomonas mediterranea]